MAPNAVGAKVSISVKLAIQVGMRLYSIGRYSNGGHGGGGGGEGGVEGGEGGGVCWSVEGAGAAATTSSSNRFH